MAHRQPKLKSGVIETSDGSSIVFTRPKFDTFATRTRSLGPSKGYKRPSKQQRTREE